MNLIITIFAVVVSLIAFLIFKIVFYPKLWMLYQKKKYGKDIEILYHVGSSTYTEQLKSFEEDGDSFSYIRKMHNKNPDAKAMAFNFGAGVGFVFLDPNLIKDVHQNHELFKKIDLSPAFSQIFKNHIILDQGNKWKAKRQFLGKVFHFTYIKSFLPEFKEVCMNEYGQIANQMINTNQSEVQAIKISQQVTSEIAFRLFFGQTQSKFYANSQDGIFTRVTSEISSIVMDSFKLMQSSKLSLLKFIIFKERSYFILPTNEEKQILDRITKLKDSVNMFIQERKGQLLKDPSLQGNNFLDNYLHEMIFNKNEDITDEIIIDGFLGMYFGGTDTTSSLIGISLYYLSTYPDIQNKAREEVVKLLSVKCKSTDPNEMYKTMEFEDLNSMDYINSILKESLRLTPPTPAVMIREAVQNVKIGQFQVNKGELVNTFFIHNQSNPSVFPNPEQFDPNRWMNPSESLSAFNFTPFSLGPRNCIGQHLVMIESKCMLAYILLNFDIIPNNTYKHKLEAKMVYGPAQDNFVIFRKRTNA